MKYDLAHLNDPIIPGKSIGGFKLNTPLRECMEMIEEFGMISELICKEKIKEPYWSYYGGWVTYEIKDTLLLNFDIYDGKLGNIVALKHYKGKLLDKICVGMTIDEAKSLVPDIYWDDDDEEYYIRGIEGVGIGTIWEDGKEVIDGIGIAGW